MNILAKDISTLGKEMVNLIRYKWAVKVEWWTRDRKYVDGFFINPIVLDINFLSPHHTNSTVNRQNMLI